jgi:HPt (histidine-containing phosphotransfer) domain-containing protein
MSDVAARIAAGLAKLWSTSRPSILERLAVLHSTDKSLSSNPEDAQARNSGREAAHKLSGILGVFGLPRGTELASEIEALLKTQDPLTPKDLTSLRALVDELDAVIASKTDA